MSRIIKLFCSEEELDKISNKVRIIENYDAFTLAEASEAAVKQIARKCPVEDITDRYTIRADGLEIDTSIPRFEADGKRRAHPAYKGAKTLSKGRHHYIVQFIGPIKEEWVKQVKKEGGEPRSPYGDFAYVVRANDKSLAKIAALPIVRWVGHLPHEARVEPSLMRQAQGKTGEDLTLPRTRIVPGIYTIEFFGPDDLKAALPAVRKLGLKVISQEPKAKLIKVEVPEKTKLSAKKVMDLAAVHGVRYIRQQVMKRSSNNIAAGIMGAGSSINNPGLGLDGSGEVIAVCDTGIDTGSPNDIHPDFVGRLAFVKSYPINPIWNSFIFNSGANDGPSDVNDGHGTHVAGSVLGSGASSQGLPGLTSPIRGLAHRARLVFQAVEQEMKWRPNAPAELKRERFILSGLPDDLTGIFTDAFRQNARIHSNSWGGGKPGEYDDQCRQLDRFVWDHKDFCVVVSAGNDGTDSDGDGKINPMSVTSPATAKNCITIGASENLRPEFKHERYGDWWPDDYPAPPFRAAPISNSANQLVAFSSRGPTRDGRIKPDVVAPGTFILSTRSTQIALNNTGWAPFPYSRFYFYMGGTSMATPLTSGAVALIRQFYRVKKHVASPTAALLKSTLIAGATRLPGLAGKSAIFDIHQGYGRVNLDAILSPAAPAKMNFAEVSPGLRTGESHQIEINVASNQVPLRVVMAYSDYPGRRLVNNLNILLTSPTRRRHVGNQMAGGVLDLDQTNNVEVIQVNKPKAGKWTLHIIGSNVPRGPQDFAIVWIGNVS